MAGPTTGVTGVMSTRITGGSERGRRLRSTRGTGLRPTSEKLRAAIFSMIGPGAVDSARVLDLYAGTGALGFEALSRGAARADFVEVDSRRCQDIRQSLQQMELNERGHVHRARVEKAWHLLDGGYDLVLIDPPYDLDPWEHVMERLGDGQMLNRGALVVVEYHYKSSLAEGYGALVRTTQRRHGDSSISIYAAGATDA